jgi:hypothetical protein
MDWLNLLKFLAADMELSIAKEALVLSSDAFGGECVQAHYGLQGVTM